MGCTMKKLSYSTVGFLDRDVEASLDAITKAGFRYVEILGQEPHISEPLSGRALLKFRLRLEQRGLKASIHAPLGTNVLGAPDEQWRLEKVKVLADYVRFAGDLGAEEIVIHPIPNPMFVLEPDNPALPKCMLDAARRSIEELIPIANKAGVRILLENLPYLCNYPLLTMRDLRLFIDAYPEESVGLTLDTGHAGISKNDPAEEIRIAGNRLCNIHLQDTDLEDDRHWLPTHGVLDWNRILQALSEIQYDNLWTFEVINGRHGENPDELSIASYRIAGSWSL